MTSAAIRYCACSNVFAALFRCHLSRQWYIVHAASYDDWCMMFVA
jgi:hypothetical protein